MVRLEQALLMTHHSSIDTHRSLYLVRFRKVRADCAAISEEEGTESNAARFYHEYFQARRPDLLHKINRATKAPQAVNPSQVEALQADIDTLKGRLG
jgi:hypothetical protein